MERDRQNRLNMIIQSDAPYKLIVAGAGTGKTYTFEQLLKERSGKCLALTLLKNLADDMTEKISELAESRTFHSFCKKLLYKLPSTGIRNDFHFFPKLSQIIAYDALILKSTIETQKKSEKSLDEAFQVLLESDGRIDFFLRRANYYNAVGFDDSVYRVLVCFRENPEKIPSFKQLVVDEYQDFNKLEVEFINCMETKSPTLIVGDDDQALYPFRKASSKYLRQKAADTKFKRFELPYSTRCTEVIVDATNAVIARAVKQHFLVGRLDKEYKCYLPDKRKDNEKYPKITHAKCSKHTKKIPFISKYIEKSIKSIPQDEVDESISKNYPLVLIVGPSYYLSQINDYLKDKFKNIDYKSRTEKELTYFDGQLCLLQNENSNLGWRIISEIDNPDLARNWLKKAEEKSCALVDVIEYSFQQKHKKYLGLLKKLKANQNDLSNAERDELEQYLEISFEKIRLKLGMTDKDIENEVEDDNGKEKNLLLKNTPIIKLTTYQGCKGLSAGFVFITGLQNEVFPIHKAKPSDSEICQFIVALTRTRKECHLISVKSFGATWGLKPSIFVNWLPDNLVKQILVNKAYFSS